MSVGRRLGACFLALHLLLVSATAHAQTPPKPPPPSAAAQPPSQPAQPAPQPPPAANTWSPAEGADVIYLKDGGQLRGTLIELRVGESAKIRLPGGQEATARWDGIARMERNGQPLPLDAKGWQPQAAPPPPAAYSPTVQPETLPYDSDQPVPTGYHVESHPRLGMVITGSILSGIGLIGIVAVEASGDISRNDKNVFDVVWGALFLGPGLPLFLVGLLSPKKTLRKDIVQAFPSPEKQPFYVGFGPTRNGGGLLTIGRSF